jgi:hypothetical protein
MHELVEYQKRFVAALLGRPDADQELAAHPAIAIHRQTVLSGLVRALSLSFPTVLKLTGSAYFEQLVREFVRRHPPHSPVLYDYGAELPAFLGAHAAGYPYFADVARFDWILEQTGHCALERPQRILPIPGYARLCLPKSLLCARFDYAVDEIRDAVDSGVDGELSAAHVNLVPRLLAFWRSPQGVQVKPLSEAAWNILRDLCAGDTAATALERANARFDAPTVARALLDEILPCSFNRLDPW